MKRTPVESSMLASVGYDPATRVLELEFTSGRVYRYGEVEEEVYRGLLAAESKGRYFLDSIDDMYPYAKVPTSRSRRRR